MSNDAANGMKFCVECGNQINIKAEICPGCGVRVATRPTGNLSKVALLLITFFLGGLGAHKFYLKKYGQGILYLLFCWTYIPGLAALIEFIIYCTKNEAELQQRYPETSKGALVAAVAVSVGGIVVVGILAAIAIPQFAAYRVKAYDSAAQSDLKSCKTNAEAYFAENMAYPTRPSQMTCSTTKGVALYYIPIASDNYQVVAYHDGGKRAFLTSKDSVSIESNDKEIIVSQISENFGAGQMGVGFHFVE